MEVICGGVLLVLVALGTLWMLTLRARGTGPRTAALAIAGCSLITVGWMVGVCRNAFESAVPWSVCLLGGAILGSLLFKLAGHDHPESG
jgi:hypothetical protein